METFLGEDACHVAASHLEQRVASCLAACQGVVHPEAFHPCLLEASEVPLCLLETCQEACVDLGDPHLGHLGASQGAGLALAEACLAVVSACP